MSLRLVESSEDAPAAGTGQVAGVERLELLQHHGKPGGAQELVFNDVTGGRRRRRKSIQPVLRIPSSLAGVYFPGWVGVDSPRMHSAGGQLA